MMTTMKNSRSRQPLPLFAPRAEERAALDFEGRLRAFARAAAARRRGEPLELERFVAALRGYHRAWTICSRSAVPALDDRAVEAAVAAYFAAGGSRKRPAA